jgi:GDPmannose 4,6-dehydratase
MRKKALITGITGQDGSYLAELLLALGYEVHGLVRRSSNFNSQRIDHLYQDPHQVGVRLHLHYADMSDSSRLTTLLDAIKPDEIYNLAAQSHVRVSFDEPVYTGDTTGLGSIRLLEAMRQSCLSAKYYQASSSEMFGSSNPPQNEETSFQPRSPYGVAKLYAHWITRNYREAYGLFAVSGILFNHESPRRGETFVTRKITKAVARIKRGEQQELFLGNLEAKRDWGYAPEYVIAMWRMLQQDIPVDFVIGTGTAMTVGDFATAAFERAGLNMADHVRFDEKYLRPAEVDALVADATKAKELLDWSPSVVGTKLVDVMLDHDLAAGSSHLVDAPIGEMWKDIVS